MSQFLRFCMVGTIGFVLDAGTLQLLVVVGHANPYTARVLSFLVAATGTWALNRRFTFRVERRPTRSEWLRYVGFTTLGALLNYGTYAACIAFSELARAQPWLGVAAGSIAALGLNFTMSRLLFRQHAAGANPQ